MEYFEFRAMNTDILLAAEGLPDRLAAGFLRARAFIDASEARLTRFSDQSELAALNRGAGNWFRASQELFEILEEAKDLSRQTEGLFDPSILDALERAGYDRSMDEIRLHETIVPRSSRTPAPRLNLSDIELAREFHAVRLPQGMRIDLGGIAKGWIAEHAANILGEHSAAVTVDAGGDLFMVGTPEDSPTWDIGLEDPFDSDRVLTLLHVEAGAVATSSVLKRRWKVDDHVRHHLIDPRSGEPAVTDWVTVTVMAPHATVAEVFAKALLIAGPREADHIARRRLDIAYVAVDHLGQLWISPEARRFVDVIPEFAL